MLTGIQIRAARIALRWSVAKLSNVCGVSTSTIKRMEVVDGVPKSTQPNLSAIQMAFESAGIEFITGQDGRPGVLFDPSKIAKR